MGVRSSSAPALWIIGIHPWTKNGSSGLPGPSVPYRTIVRLRQCWTRQRLSGRPRFFVSSSTRPGHRRSTGHHSHISRTFSRLVASGAVDWTLVLISGPQHPEKQTNCSLTDTDQQTPRSPTNPEAIDLLFPVSSAAVSPSSFLVRFDSISPTIPGLAFSPVDTESDPTSSSRRPINIRFFFPPHPISHRVILTLDQWTDCSPTSINRKIS